jgi:polyphosphate kinase 2 (PPK2 family)
VRYLDPRGLRVHALGPPTSGDLQQHYLRRYWMRLPKSGRISVFDDYSWYGRLLLEPIEGLCTPEAYARAPREICELERMLVDDGVCLIKIWLHISRGEQLRRFKKRLSDPYKSWKLTPEDWRNNELYEDYIAHADAMFELTSTPQAPWRLIAGDDKLYARVAVLRTIRDALAELAVAPVSRPRGKPARQSRHHTAQPED